MLDVKALTRESVFRTFSSPAQLAAPGLLPVAVDAIGPDERLVETPTSGGFTVAERQTVFALRRDQLPAGAPRGSELTQYGMTWVVDGMATDDGDIVTVIVRRA